MKKAKKAKKEWIILLCATLLLGVVWLFTHDNPLRRRFMPLTMVTIGEGIHALTFSPDGTQLQVMSVKNDRPDDDKQQWEIFATSNGDLLRHTNKDALWPAPWRARIPALKPLQLKPRRDWIHRLTRLQLSPDAQSVAGVLWQQRIVFRGGEPDKPSLLWGPARVLDLKTNRLSPPLGGTAIRRIFFTPNKGQVVIWESGDGFFQQLPGTLSWWDWRRARRLKTIALAPYSYIVAAPKLLYALRVQRLDKNNRPSIADTKSSVLQAFDLRDGRQLWEYRAEGAIDEETIGFSQDASRLCFAQNSKQFEGAWLGMVLEGSRGRELARYSATRTLAMSLDGKRLATARTNLPYGGRVTLHDLSRLTP